jgi:hypothetical protein
MYAYVHVIMRHTGFEDSKEFPIRKNDLIAGRYKVCLFYPLVSGCIFLEVQHFCRRRRH